MVMDVLAWKNTTSAKWHIESAVSIGNPPVRPMPALQCTTIGAVDDWVTARMARQNSITGIVSSKYMGMGRGEGDMRRQRKTQF